MRDIHLERRRALLRQLTAPSFLPIAVREGLHREGWTEIHQHQLEDFHSCGARLGFRLRGGGSRSPVTYLLGSVAHAALAHDAPAWSDPGWWKGCFMQVRIAHPQQAYVLPTGVEVHGPEVTKLAVALTQPQDQYGGYSIGQLMAKLADRVREHYIVLGVEERLTLVDGKGRSPVSFVGTVDLRVQPLRGRPRIGILDFKTYDAWEPVLKAAGFQEEAKVPHAQRPPPGSLGYNKQLRHYAWLTERTGGGPVTFVGQVFLSNLVPSLTGANKGQPRGLPLVEEPLPDGAVADYEEGLRGVLRQASFGQWPKEFPSEWGQSGCLKCQFRGPCYGGLVASQDLSLFAEHLYREEAAK